MAIIKEFTHYDKDATKTPIRVFKIDKCDCGAEILAPNSINMKKGNFKQTIKFFEDSGLKPAVIPTNECWPDDNGDCYCDECEGK